MSFYFCHLSDTHIVADTRAVQHGINPYDSLHRMIVQIANLDPPPAFVIFTGDLIDDDDPQSYRNLKQLIDRLPGPTYFALGNHDMRQPFRQIILGEMMSTVQPYYYTFEAEGYRFIVLDSLVEGEVAGALGRAQLAWLRQALAAESHQPTVLFVHHPPAPTGIDWLDLHVLADSDALIDLLRMQSQVHRVFFGHVHMSLQITVQGVHCTSVPSTCYQFGDAVIVPKRLPGPPGYGVVQIQKGRISSRVVFL